MLAHLAVLAAEKADTINPVVPDEIGEIVWGAIGFFGVAARESVPSRRRRRWPACGS